MVYTIEIFAPPFPNRGRKLKVHRGSFERNRERLASTLIVAKEVEASNAREARKLAMADPRFAGILNKDRK